MSNSIPSCARRCRRLRHFGGGRFCGERRPAWRFQARSLEKFEATPLVVDGVLYTVQAPNDVVAMKAVSGRVFWVSGYTPSPEARVCCGRVNRGLAILGDTLFMGTIDGHLLALDAKSGKPIWNVTVAKAEAGYSLMHAPLVVKDKVIVGVAGGEFGIRGFLAAYDARTGKQEWKFNTIPGPGDPLSHHTSGYAKVMCSAVFITGLDPEFAAENVGYFTSPYAERAKVAKPVVDRQNKTVQIKLPNGVMRTAKYLGDQGCVTLPVGKNSVNFTPHSVKGALPDASFVGNAKLKKSPNFYE